MAHKPAGKSLGRPALLTTPEKVLLVGAGLKNQSQLIASSLEELKRLAETAGAVIVGEFTQRLEKYHPGTLIGEGKIEEIAAAAKKMQSADPLIASVELFDVFEGKNLPAGKKSMAYHVLYRSLERTLTAEEVDAAHGRVIAMLGKQFTAEIRK